MFIRGRDYVSYSAYMYISTNFLGLDFMGGCFRINETKSCGTKTGPSTLKCFFYGSELKRKQDLLVDNKGYFY